MKITTFFYLITIALITSNCSPRKTSYFDPETCLRIQYPNDYSVQNSSPLPFFQLYKYAKNEHQLLAELTFTIMETQNIELDSLINETTSVFGKNSILTNRTSFSSSLGDGVKATLLAQGSSKENKTYFFLTKNHYVFVEGSSDSNIPDLDDEFDKIVESAVLNCD